MPISVGFRGADCPVGIRYAALPTSPNNFFARAQEFSVELLVPKEPVYEMGRLPSVGTLPRPRQYTAQMILNTHQMTSANLTTEMSLAHIDASPPPVTIALQNYIDGIGGASLDLWLTSPYGELGYGHVAAVEYRASATGVSQSIFSFRGTGVVLPGESYFDAPGSDLTIPGAYYGGTTQCQVDGTVMQRVQSVTIRANLNILELYQLSTVLPAGTGSWLAGVTYDPPIVTAEVEVVLHENHQIGIWNQDAGIDALGLIYFPDSIITPSKTITMHHPELTGVPTRGSVRGWATMRFQYTSATSEITVINNF